MSEPIPVPSDETGGVTSQVRPVDMLDALGKRVAVLEKTARNTSASIGRGGINVYDGGAFRWFNYDYDNQLAPDDPDNVDSMVYEIGAFQEDDLEDYGVSFNYYFPNKAVRGGLPVAVMGRFPQVNDSNHDSHGIAVFAIGNDSDRPMFAASDDGIALQKSKDREPGGGSQRVLWCMKDDNDEFALFLSNEQSFFAVMADSGGKQRAEVFGGNSGTGYGSRMQMRGTSGGDDRSVHFLNSDNTSNYVDLHADNFVNEPSSVAFKDMLGVKESDFVATVMGAPVQRWTRKVPDETVDPETGRLLSEDEHVFTEKFSPTVETMPEECVVRGPDTTGLSLNASLWTLWGAVQQQQKLIEELTTQVAALSKR